MLHTKKQVNKIKDSLSDRAYQGVISVLMVLLIVAIAYPLIYVISCSFSSGAALAAGKVIFLPVDFSLTGYAAVLRYKQVWTGYLNAIIITVVATSINMVLTTMAAYPLSRRNLQWKGFYSTFFLIVMFFSGGIIPSYILMTKLHLVDTRWSIILSGGINIYNMIIMRTFFQNSIPNELLEAAKIDGITDIGYLFKIVIPLSKAIYAVLILYYAVAHWNAYFNAMLYIRDLDLYPLQLVLKDILSGAKVDLSRIDDAETLEALTGLSNLMKYAVIIISTLPVLAVFPFVQKHFEKGVMIGSVKG